MKDQDVVAQAAISHTNEVPGRLEVVQYALSLGAPIDIYGNRNVDPIFWTSRISIEGIATALQYAVEGGKEDMVKLLLDGGADKNIRAEFSNRSDGKRLTPLEVAEERGFDNIIKLLTNSSGRINKTNSIMKGV
jgi:hypothetical protein